MEDPTTNVVETKKRPVKDRARELKQIAERLFGTRPAWIIFFREIFGTEGIVNTQLSTPEERVEFEATNEYAEMQQMVSELRETQSLTPDSNEPTRVITIRMPKSLHDSLKQQAADQLTSMNRLCITKLLQPLKTPATDK